jgi:hypothetical protein
MDFNFSNAGGQTNSPSMTRPANTQRTARVTGKPQNLDRQPQNLDNGRNEQISPTSYRTKDDYEHAKDAAFKRFDAEWDARKKALERAKDYYDYQADHSNGAARDQWEAKKEQTNRQMDELDDQKDAAKDVLTKKWND